MRRTCWPLFPAKVADDVAPGLFWTQGNNKELQVFIFCSYRFGIINSFHKRCYIRGTGSFLLEIAGYLFRVVITYLWMFLPGRECGFMNSFLHAFAILFLYMVFLSWKAMKNEPRSVVNNYYYIISSTWVCLCRPAGLSLSYCRPHCYGAQLQTRGPSHCSGTLVFVGHETDLPIIFHGQAVERYGARPEKELGTKDLVEVLACEFCLQLAPFVY